MSWLFSRALVAESSGDRYSDIVVSAQSKSTTTPQAFSSDAKTMDTYRHSRYGMTCGRLTESLGAALLMSYLVGSRARTLAPQEKVPDSTVSGRGFGEKWPASWLKYDPALCSWKTAQFSLLGDSGSFSGTWPQWGSMLDGACYQQPSVAPTTSVNGSGLLPTLCARDFRYPGKSRMERTGSSAGEVLPQIVGGPLNPAWCEWFMGFPIGWTESAPLATAKFREWQQQHGAF